MKVSAALPWNSYFSDLQGPIAEVGPDNDSVPFIPQRVLQFPTAAQAPIPLIVFEDKGNGVRQFGMNVKVLEEFFARHFTVDW